MARRPQRMPRWAYDAAGSRLTEPPESEQLNGWNTNDRPPAQYFNWMFHYHSAWCDFLRGPSLAKWQSDTLPYDTSELTSASLAVDSATTEGTSLVKRNIIAAVDGGGNCVFTSVRAGNATSWTRRTNFTASGTFWRAFFCGPSGSERFWICVDHASVGVLLTTAANSAVLSGTGNWTSATLPGGTKGVRAVAYDGSAYWAAVARDTIIATPNASPTSWTAATLGTAVTGTFRDLVWTGTAFLAVTNQGEVYRAGGGSAAAATWTALSAMPPGAADWRFTVGPDGTVLAWVENLGAAADFYTTDDDGDSWTAVTSSPSVERIKSITFADSVWMAATVEAPYLWQSNDATAWTRLKLPYAGATTVYDVAYSEGSWLAARNAFVEVSARAEDIAAGTWAPDPTTSSLGNAGWFRGRALSETAPTNGQVYVWNSSTSKWTPTTISASLPTAAGANEVPASTGAGTTYSAVTVPALLATINNTRGRLLRRGSSAWESFAASTADTFVGGDGTDVTVRTAAQARASIIGPYADDMTGTGWSAIATSGGASASWGSSKLTCTVTAATGSCGVERAAYLPSADGYELATRVDVTTGDTDANTRYILITGQDANNAAALSFWADGSVESGRIVGGVYTRDTLTSGPDSGQRTGGQLWVRISRSPQGVGFFWGVGSGGALPMLWTPICPTITNVATLLASCGTYAQIYHATTGSTSFVTETLAIYTARMGAL